jgi:2',3'-cyclic-nucleotide 2'-phosphodiesterase (5'-nucleotidase family)
MKLFHFLFLFLVLLSCKNVDRNLSKITAKIVVIDSTIEPSIKIERMIAPYKEKLIDEMEQVLSYTSKDLTRKTFAMQSTLGNLKADMCFEMSTTLFKEKTNTAIDFAMFNYGGLRASISAGSVTKAEAFKLMPFENELVVVNITAKKVVALINYFIQNKTAHPLSKNIALLIKENTYKLKINDQTFDKNKTYNVLTSDYLQDGGDKMNFFKNPERLTKLNYKVRDAIINYFEKVDTLKISIDKRIIIEK